MKKNPAQEVEFHPDAWKRFERAVGAIAKSPPQHRVKPKTKPKVKRTTSPKKKASS